MKISDIAINQTAKSQSYDDFISQTYDNFIKEHLPILPEFQSKYKSLMDTVSPEVRQRAELMSRAYSAAVYAHKNHLDSSQKQIILNEFNTQCFSVLGQISDIVEFAKGNPVAERHALLKDYQLWVNQLEDLLKKVIYALDYDEWAQQIVAISSSNAPKETVVNLLRKVLEIFDPHICYGNYFPKFNNLFHSQVQLEQRVSLALGITVEWIDVWVATRKKTEKSYLLNERALTGEPLAIALLVEHPDWHDTKIAKAVGVSRTTLYDWPNFKKAKEALRHVEADLASTKPAETGGKVKRIVAAIVISFVMILLFELFIYFGQFTWVKNHPRSYGIQGSVICLIPCLIFGFFKPRWRRWCWGTAAIAFLVGLLNLL